VARDRVRLILHAGQGLGEPCANSGIEPARVARLDEALGLTEDDVTIRRRVRRLDRVSERPETHSAVQDCYQVPAGLVVGHAGERSRPTRYSPSALIQLREPFLAGLPLTPEK
jgi:hypothetical protein